jgi:predicted TIM-barrel enzyme
MWSDNAGLREAGDDKDAVFLKNMRTRTLTGKSLQYFGGVEFKYQRQPKEKDLEWVYERAKELVDVITTSGPGTGKEIGIEKLKRIRDAVGNHPIAVASGVNESNKRAIEKYADYLLVASSITDPATELILPEKLKRLIHA